jgi:uncharacterized protein
MALYYFDTSALVKQHVLEPGSTWVRSLINSVGSNGSASAHTVFISAATIAEVAAALAILFRRGIIRRCQHEEAYDRFATDLADRYILVEILLEDFYSSATLARKHGLKAYDAVQLAVALRHNQDVMALGPSITFVTGDRALLRAAEAEGLTTDNPFDHPSPLDQPGSN